MIHSRGLDRWLKYIVIGALLFVLLYEFAVWYDLYVYQLNGAQYFPEWQIFWATLAANPVVIFVRNWGSPYGLYLPVVIAVVVASIIAQRRKWIPFEIVDAPWQYVVAAAPLTLICLAVIGVGSSLNWFWDSSLNIPNDLYSFFAHFCAAFGISLWIACFDIEGALNLKNRWKWLLTLAPFLILAFYWENVEGLDLLAHGGIPTPSFYTNLRDSLADLLADGSACACALGLWNQIWDHVHPDGWQPEAKPVWSRSWSIRAMPDYHEIMNECFQ